MGSSVAVLGAGIVGVCCALELQRCGRRVTLIDRRGPGQETSYGNAGVIARSSLMPLNNPGLWRLLPSLITNSSPAFRYDPRFLIRNPRWAIEFLWRARRQSFSETVAALDSLIRLSATRHESWLREAGAEHRLQSEGWLFLYRDRSGYDKASLARETYDRIGISIPMAFERGYHMHYGAKGNATLGRPVYDTAGAYVLSPMEQGFRLTTGVELTDQHAPKNPVQLGLAEAAAREGFPIAERLEDEPWVGSRPTLPDSRPIIDAVAMICRASRTSRK